MIEEISHNSVETKFISVNTLEEIPWVPSAPRPLTAWEMNKERPVRQCEAAGPRRICSVWVREEREREREVNDVFSKLI
jgi:hypothetical protein